MDHRYFDTAIANLRAEFDGRFNQLAAHFRGQQERVLREASVVLQRQLAELADIARGIRADQGRYVEPGTIRIEDIPGRRVPYTLCVDIAIGPDVTSVRQASATISQEGPFVATKRVMAFQSAYEFQTTDPVTDAVARLPGRSFGRYRPVHSAADIADAQHNAQSSASAWYARASDLATAAGLRLPSAVISLPSSASSFRTMEFDGRVLFINEGSSVPRQNLNNGIPTTMWCAGVNDPFELGALDFFERGEILTFQVTPLHGNNSQTGNVQGANIFGELSSVAATTEQWPFIAGLFDVHEGIASPSNGTSPSASAAGGGELTAFRQVTPITTDTVTRIPNGIVTIGFDGYKIWQPVGPVR